jgi:iron complex transport system substrate-binding protein
MRGLSTLRKNVRDVARLVGAPERGYRLIARFEQRLRRVAGGVTRRPTALYVGLHGAKLYGGAAGTSFHDVLTYAGLSDVAATRFEGWPSYTAEQILSLDPEVIVTQSGMRRALCGRYQLDTLRACRTARIVEIPAHVISDPGLVMLDAAELVHDAVFGSGTTP